MSKLSEHRERARAKRPDEITPTIKPSAFASKERAAEIRARVRENAEDAVTKVEKDIAREQVRSSFAIIPRANRVIAALIVVSLIVSAGQIAGQIVLSLENLSALARGESNVPGVVSVVYVLLVVANAVGLIMLIRFDRQEKIFEARMCTRALVVLLLAGLLCCVALNGINWLEATYLFQFVCAIAYQVYNDPNLDRRPRFLTGSERKEAIDELSYDKDPDRRKYIPLNFFNLFWIFIVASMLGLAIEMVFCLLVNGVWKDRAGLVWGPFSPIYGVGAVLMTVVLNKYWYRNAIVIMAVAGFIGAAFEFFVSWYMETAFGVIAWDYSGTFLSIQGRTDFAHFLAWGALGVVWIRMILPVLMRIVNMIALRWRALLTVLMFAFMLVNGVTTVLALDCWSQRVAGEPVQTEVQQYFAQHYPDSFMQTRFSTMGINQERALRAQNAH